MKFKDTNRLKKRYADSNHKRDGMAILNTTDIKI